MIDTAVEADYGAAGGQGGGGALVTAFTAALSAAIELRANHGPEEIAQPPDGLRL
ncbi:MAG TPA: hypothetical protein VIJ07_17460 [Dermatophilaceae bacterium]